MKKNIITLALILFCSTLIHAQPIPTDSLYLGQIPPGNIPKVFTLSVTPGSFDAERISISPDNKTIYYSEVHSYYPTTGGFIKYYKYSGNHWTGPFNLFQNYIAAALTSSGDTMIFQNSNSDYQSFYSVWNSSQWSNPRRFLNNLNSAHYCQKISSGKYYISSNASQGIGGNDWCTLNISTPDTTAVSLGLPVNTSADNLDFYISRDESFMILAKGDLMVSYHKDDGNWTNPKTLGALINFGLGAWGPYVTADQKYLFYTTGTHPDYSDTHVHWVRIDSLVDSLRYTNYAPYVKNLIPEQFTHVGELFNFTVPDTTFIDDDGNETLTYSATLANGLPLPYWLNFDSVTATFSGVPEEITTLNIRIKATDSAGLFVYAMLRLNVLPPVDIREEKVPELSISPNPTDGFLTICLKDAGDETAVAEIKSLDGKEIIKKDFKRKTSFDLSGCSGGIYLLKVEIGDRTVVKRVCVF